MWKNLKRTCYYCVYSKINVRMYKLEICVYIIMLSLVQCTKPEVHAHESLAGMWQVDSISILYTKPPGSTIDSIWKRSMPAGKIIFTEKEIITSYMSRNQKTEFTSNYTIESSKENAGFFRVRKWHLMTAHVICEIEYGDQTKNAHKKAKYITLSCNSKLPNNTETEILFMSKQ